MKHKGKFIIIEGTDGSGKTTQLNLLKTWLVERGEKVFVTDFPQYGEFWGKLVGKFLRGDFGDIGDVSPYLASPLYLLDQQSQNAKIKSLLNEGYFVLSNRYVTSSMAHQTCKFPTVKEQKGFLDWLVEAAYKKLKLIKEDLTIVLFVDPEIAQRFSKAAGGRKSVYTFGTDIAEGNMKHLCDSASMYRKCTELFTSWELINCMNPKNHEIESIEMIHEKIISLMNEKFFSTTQIKGGDIRKVGKRQLEFI